MIVSKTHVCEINHTETASTNNQNKKAKNLNLTHK